MSFRRLSVLVWLAIVPMTRGQTFDLARELERTPPGGTLVVPSGQHRGPFVIRQPLRMWGQPGAVLVGDGLTHVVQIRAPDVELAGFIIRHSGSDLSKDHAGVHIAGPRALVRDNTIVDCLHGIYVYAADEVRLLHNVIRGRANVEAISDPVTRGIPLTSAELCADPIGQDQRGNGIHLWKSVGLEIAGNDIRGTRDGIYFSFTDRTLVRGNVISQVRYGLHYMYSDENTFEDNLFTDNAAGSALMFSADLRLTGNRFVANRSHRAYGLLMHSVDRTVVERNVIDGNTVGVYLESTNQNRFIGNRITGNYVGLRCSQSSSDNAVAGNVFDRNLHPVETTGVTPDNRWELDGQGNYWAGAYRLDLDEDGITDLPHHEIDLFGGWRRDFPEIALLSGSPGERLMRFIYSRSRVPGLPGITDPHPLVRAAP